MQTKTGLNGVDVSALLETIQAIQDAPNLASFSFRATNKWEDGGYNRTTVSGFYGAGEEQTRQQPFVLDAAEPPVLLGEDQGANPVEHLLHALAGCLTTSMVYHAAARGIRIESIESELEGDIDLHGFLGLSDEVRKGYQNIRVTFRVKADAPAEELEALCKFSPVFDTIANPVDVAVTVQT